jgi:hypothetical protein
MAVTLAMIPSAIAAPKTTIKAAGRVTTTVVNTILNGVGVPAKTVGINGDFYIDTKNLVLYGPKVNGSWKNSTSLKQSEIKSVATTVGEVGAVGDKGAQGIQGIQGNTGLDGSAGAAGVQGIQGDTGTSGTNGAQGIQGDTGATGVQGIQGAAGLDGATGLQGIQGVQGDAGSPGVQGIQGIKGDQGTIGTQGVQGDAGISISYFLDLGTWILGTNRILGTSDSNVFANLGAGSYTFEIMVDGTFSPSTSVEIAIGMQLIASAGTLDYWVFASDALAYINYDGSRHYQFMIIGKIVCTGTANLKLRAVDQMGATADNLLNFSGRALINKVGSIG